MNTYLIFILTAFCQILSTSSSPVNQELDDEVIVRNIFTDYINTEFGAIKIHNTRASWNDARNICLDEKSQLVVIDSAAEEAMLLKHMNENGMIETWIGVHDFFEKTQWTTIKGQRLHTLNYVNWNVGEPNGYGAGERCVEINQGGMNDRACNTEMGFICKKSSADIRCMVVLA